MDSDLEKLLRQYGFDDEIVAVLDGKGITSLQKLMDTPLQELRRFGVDNLKSVVIKQAVQNYFAKK